MNLITTEPLTCYMKAILCIVVEPPVEINLNSTCKVDAVDNIIGHHFEFRLLHYLRLPSATPSTISLIFILSTFHTNGTYSNYKTSSACAFCSIWRLSWSAHQQSSRARPSARSSSATASSASHIRHFSSVK
jgi:hypothetical protein